MRSKKLWLVSLLAVLFAFIGVFAAACETKDEPETPTTAGPETGVYYYDSDSGDEYLITLTGGKNVTFIVKDVNKSGVYTLDGEALSFTLEGEEDAITATLKDDVLTLTYNESEMRFLKKITYTVSFDAAGGSAVSSVSVVNGRTATKPADPERDGYSFVGWYTSEDYDTVFEFDSQIIRSSITLYARWREVSDGRTEFTVSFDLGYDAVNPSDVQTVNGKITDLPTPTRDGYIFCGWWVSMYDDADKLTYIYKEGTVFEENTTLFALWQSSESSTRLATPYVTISGNTITWDAVAGASTYSLEISGPDGFKTVSQPQVDGTSYTYDFTSAPAGDYEIKVVAKASSGSAYDSDAAYSYYKNKALARVSVFSVNELSMLIFNGVANAEKYYITVECGNADHNHTLVDNGSSTYYSFANCEMKQGGITFVVTATADGYASSTSRVFVYSRDLGQITGIKVDEETETLSWNAVANATSYLVTVSVGGATETVNVGSATSFSLKNYASGTLEISVTAQAKGYNASEEAVYTYNKVTLSVPENLRVAGTVLSWDEVEGATSYEIRIGSRIYTSETASFELESATDTEWVKAEDYQVSVRAIGASASVWSDVVDMRYYAMYNTLTYSQNVVSWRYVIGATRYEVRVNGGTAISIKDGSNQATVTLTQAGYNTVAVRFYDGSYSDWAEIEVFAYAITFDSREGAGVDSVYVAVGDAVALPETTQNGYVFSGWYNAPSGAAGNAQRYEDEYFSGNSDLVLYAYWTPQEYVLTLNNGEYGTEDGGTVSVYYRGSYVIPAPQSTNAQYGFIGWYTAPTGGTQLTDETGASLNGWQTVGDATVYAHWAAVLSYTYDSITGGYAVTKGSGIVSVTEVTVAQTYDDGVHGEKNVTVVTAFGSVSSLIKINIPDTVLNIETTAFSSCSNLQEINIIRVEGNNTAAFTSVDGVLIKYTAPESGDYINSTIDDTAHGDYQLYYFPRGKGGDYVVPDFITDIRGEAFRWGSSKNTKLTSVTIPASVTNIGASAFYNCTALESVTFISNTAEDAELVIGKNAFYGCIALSVINLPSHLTDFDITIFSGCTGITEINVADGNEVYSSIDGVLCDAGATTIIYFPLARTGSYTIPSLIRTIGGSAFANSQITEITIHSGVTRIEALAFYKATGLQKVTFTSPMEGAAVTGITIESGTSTTTGAFSGCSSLSEIIMGDGTKLISIGDYAFYGCSALTGTLELPATLTYVGNMAFDSTSFTEIVFKAPTDESAAAALEIADGTKSGSTNKGAFTAMSSLISVTFEEGSNVTKIGKHAFASDTNLVGTLEIPATVTEIGTAAFYKTSITALVFLAPAADSTAAGLTIMDGNGTSTSSTVEQGAFATITTLRTVTFQEGSYVEVIGAYAFAGDTLLETIVFSQETKAVNDYAFSGCTSLSAVTFADGGTTYGASVFNGCTKLTTVYLGASLSGLDVSIFAGCAYLTDIIVDPANESYKAVDGVLYEINADGDPISLMYCPAAKASGFTIPDTVTVLAAGIFQGRTLLTSITIGKNVTEIGDSAFNGCTGLEQLIFEKGGTEALTIGNQAFSGCTSLAEVEIPARTTYIGYGAFYKCVLTTLTFEDAANEDGMELVLASGTAASTGVFAYAQFTSVTLPERLVRIGAYAFAYCQSLKSIVIPKNVQNGEYVSGVGQEIGIGNHAFFVCSVLESFTFEEGGTGDLTLGTSAITTCRELTSIKFPARLAAAKDADGNTLYPLGASTADTPYLFFYNYATTIPTTTVSDGVTKIASISIEEGNAYYSSYQGILYNADGTTVMYCPEDLKNATIKSTATTIAPYAFIHAYYLNTLTIEEGTEPFVFPAARAYTTATFLACADLTTVNLASRVTEIGAYTFLYSPIQNLNFAENGNLTTIGTGAFFMARKLTSVTIPATVTSIGASAFAGSALRSVVFEDGAEDAKLVVTGGTTASTSLSYSSGYTNNGAFSSCTSLETVALPSHLEEISAYMFWNCPSLYEIKFPTDNNGNSTSRVSSIAAYAFASTGIDSINLPNSVTTVEAKAFDSCTSLFQVTLSCNLDSNFVFANVFSSCAYISDIQVNPATDGEGEGTLNVVDGVIFSADGTTLMYYVSNKLDATYTVPETVKTISAGAFNANANLQTLILNRGLTDIGSTAFKNCTSLSTISFVMGAEGGSLQSIGMAAFRATAITTLTIPYTVTSIGTAAFYGCTSLKEIIMEAGGSETLTITEGSTTNSADTDAAFKLNSALERVVLTSRLTALPNYAFQSCSSLTTINLDYITYLGKYAFASCSSLVEIDLSKVQTTGERVLSSCTSLTTVQLPLSATYTTTGDYMFSSCTALEEIDIPENITTIGASTFYQCYALMKVTLPETVTEIGKQAFYQTFIREINLEHITTIGDSAFASTFLTVADLHNVTSLGSSAFSKATMLKEIIWPTSEKFTAIPTSAFANCTSLTSVVIPETVTTINAGAFMSSGLTSISIPATVTTIGKGAFAGCNSLTSVTFESGRTSAPTITAGTSTSTGTSAGAFANCPNLTEIVWPEKITTITAYTFSKSGLTEVTIPSTVTTIDTGAFLATGLTSITIPASVTTIGKGAFAGSESLESVTFESGRTKALTITAGTSTTVGGTAGAFASCPKLTEIVWPSSFVTSLTAYTFYGSGLTSISIPTSVTTIGLMTFGACTSLEEVTFDANGSSALTITGGTAAKGAFYGCTALTSIVIPARLSAINAYTFQGCTNLATVTFETGASTNKLTTIALNSFYDSGLQSITEIPTTVTTVAIAAFTYLSSLETVTFADGGTSALTLTAGTGILTTSVTNLAKNGVFAHCTSLTTVKLPARVKTIGAYAFYNCTSLTSVTIGEGTNQLSTIGNYAFYDCAQLEAVTLPSTVTSIGTYAFYNCSALEAVTLPSQLASISDYAFYNCASLGSVEIPASVTSIGNYAFRYCEALTTVTVPGTVVSIGNDAFANTGLESVVIADGVQTIGNLVFENCASLQSVQIGSSITSIGQNPFYGCKALTKLEVSGDYTVDSTDDYIALYDSEKTTLIAFIGACEFTIPSSVTQVGVYAFGNTGVTGVVFTNTDTVIGDYAFWCAFNLESVTLPANLKSIGAGVFYQCYLLSEITLPATLESIGKGAFAKSGLVSVTIPNNVATIDIGAFWYCAALESVVFAEGGEEALTLTAGTAPTPSSYTTAGVFQNCVSLTSVTLTDRLSEIAAYAFYGTGNLKITLPESVVSLGNYAFSTAAIESIDISNITTLGTNVFRGCEYLTSVTFSQELDTIPNFTFYGCVGLESFTIPENVTTIGTGVFTSSGLTSVTIPATVLSIGKSAFSNLAALETLVFEEGEEELAITAGSSADYVNGNAGAFAFSPMLTSVTLAERVTELTAYTFYSTGELTIDLSNVATLGNYVFAYSGNVSVTFGSGISSIGTYLFAESAIESVDLSPLTADLGANAFQNCVYLEDVVFSNSFTTIPAYAFQNCVSLAETELDLSSCDSLTSIGNYAFNGIKVTSIVFGAALQTIGTGSFQECEELASVEFDVDGVLTTIGQYAFDNCQKLVSVTGMPATLVTINTYSFRDTAISSFELAEGSANVAVGNSAFENTRITSFDFAACKSIGTYAFANTLITEVDLSDSAVTSITTGVFQNCTELRSFTSNTKVTTIANYAFQGCTSLAKVELCWYMYSIGSYVFDGCTSLKELVIPAKILFWAAGGIGTGTFNGWTADQTVYFETYTEAEGTSIGTNWADDWRSGCNANIVWEYSPAE